MRSDAVLHCLFAFLCGSIPFGLLVARLFHVKNLSDQGSGNIGATNVSRILGFWPAGLITFVLDVAKGVLPVLVIVSDSLQVAIHSMVFGSQDFEHLGPGVAWAAGFFAVAGHCFSPWVRFKGGKGVATGFGVLLVISPGAAAAGIAGFAATFASKRIGSLASLFGLLVAVVAQIVFFPIDKSLLWGAVLVFLILIRHEANIDALLADEEKAFN